MLGYNVSVALNYFDGVGTRDVNFTELLITDEDFVGNGGDFTDKEQRDAFIDSTPVGVGFRMPLMKIK